MFKQFFSCVLVICIAVPAIAQTYPETTFAPGKQWYDVDAAGKLTLYEIPEIGNQALKSKDAVPVAAWTTMIAEAQKMAATVRIGFDPATRAIMYVVKPENAGLDFRLVTFKDGVWYIDENRNGHWDGCGAGQPDRCLKYGSPGDAVFIIK